MFDLLQTLGIATIFSGALVLIVRKLIEQFFSKDLEKFKIELEKEAIKYKKQFDILHTERAVVIKEVYKLIVRTQRAFASLMCPLQLAGEPSQEEKTKILIDKYNELATFFLENRLFFDETLALEIDRLLSKFLDIWNRWNYAKEYNSKKIPKIEEWGKIWDEVKDEIPKIEKSIEQKFREIIGI